MPLMKAEYLVVLSFALTFTVVCNAFYTKRQFYPSVVYLTKSSTSLAVLYVQAFVFFLLVGKLVQRIFLGQLRAIETEHLYDRTWFSVTETCLAFTVFRDDFSPRFVGFFAVLLFLKCFHWLLEDRVDYMEQSPVLGRVFHGRIISLLSLLLLCDYLFITTAYSHTLVKGASVQIVFGFEYAILLVSVISTGTKYLLHSIEIRTGEQWENKGVFMLYADLILGFCRLVLYMIFMLVMMRIHTFPLFAIRPMFIAMRAFRKSCTDVIESRRAIRSLNTLYPDLSAEELATVTDTTCIICREEMLVQQSIKRLGCQHIFHKNCLRSWFQRQQTCPICRTTVLRPLGAQLLGTPGQAPAGAQAAAGVAAAAPAGATGATPPPNAAGQSLPGVIQGNGGQAGANGLSPPPFFNFTPFNLNNLSNTNNPPSQSQQTSLPFGPFSTVLPPFAFPPPPLPPLNFSGMSEESIRAMEETELQHVQARIQCLRNVQNLLDASMLQMQTYMNIVQTQSNMNNSNTILQDLNLDTERVLQPRNSKQSLNELPGTTTSETIIDGNESPTEPAFIRRRRVEHFTSPHNLISPDASTSMSTATTTNSEIDNNDDKK